MTRVSSGTLTVVVFAILAGLAGAYVVRQRLATPPPMLPPIAEATPNDVIIPVAAIDLQPGQQLSLNDIAILRFAPEQFAKSKFVNMAYMRDSNQIQNRKLKTGVKQGEVFLTTSFYPDGAGPGIAEMLEQGFRAVTIPIEHISAVQGFARPGSFVDVLFRSTKDEDRPEVTITLLERVEVLAVNTNTLSDLSVELDHRGTVTLAVTPDQAKALKVVEDRGELSLTLRNPNDDLDFLPVDLDRGKRVRGIAGEPDQPQELHPVNKLQLNDDPRNAPWLTGMERVTQGTDKVSLDDLLNIPPKKKPESMVIYHGGSRKVIIFDNEAASASEPYPQMIRIPVDRPFVRDDVPTPENPKVRTVQFDNRPTPAGG